jgi:anti-sigma factor RsiW
VRKSVAIVLERSYLLTPIVLGQQLVDPLRVATVLVVTGRSSLTAILAVEAVTAGALTMGLIGELAAVATAAAEATRTVMSSAPHVVASTPARKSKNYGARRPPRQATTTASPPSLRGFATYSSRRNSSL